jgi:two-component system, chemotaxis family, response regulator Rcp1
MQTDDAAKPFEVLLVEDNPADARLTQEAFVETGKPFHLNKVVDGIEALAFLRKQGEYNDAPQPHLVLLDLNLPKKNGYYVLEEMKKDPLMRKIPVVILTSSKAPEDILRTYALYANCYLTKPVELDQFVKMVKALVEFWACLVKVPVA